MLYREAIRDPLAAMASVVELEEGVHSLLNHLSTLMSELLQEEVKIELEDLEFRLNEDSPLIETFNEEWAVHWISRKLLIGYVDRKPVPITAEDRFKPFTEKEVDAKNHFEVIWEYYSHLAILTTPRDSNEVVMQCIDPEVFIDAQPGAIFRVRGRDFRAVILTTHIGLIVYIVTTEHLLNVDTKHGIVVASDAVEQLTQLTGYIGDDDLTGKLSHIFGTGIVGDNYRSKNWAQVFSDALLKVVK